MTEMTTNYMKNQETMNDNMIEIMVKLQIALENIHWLMSYRSDNNQNIKSKDVAEVLNRCEEALAESEYLWENRYEKGN